MTDTSEVMKRIGVRLRQRRNAKGIGMQAAAEALGMGKSSFAELERGTIPLTIGRLLDYARLLEIAPTALIPELKRARPLRLQDDAYNAAVRELDLSLLLTVSELSGRSAQLLIADLKGLPR